MKEKVDHKNLYFSFPFFLLNASKYTNKYYKRISQSKIEQVFEEGVQDCKDGSGLQLIFGQ